MSQWRDTPAQEADADDVETFLCGLCVEPPDVHMYVVPLQYIHVHVLIYVCSKQQRCPLWQPRSVCSKSKILMLMLMSRPLGIGLFKQPQPSRPKGWVSLGAKSNRTPRG
jgi:hypothetical protein